MKLTSRAGLRRTQFELWERGQSLGRFSTLLLGAYNLGNIVAAFAIARAEGCNVEQFAEAIQLFRGVKRRQELLGMVAGVRVIQDFAHHPTAVDLTVKATRRRYRDQALHVCFEPRSSSSRRDVFFEGYTRAFDAATRVYVAPVYAPEKVPDGKLLDVDALAAALREARQSMRGRSCRSPTWPLQCSIRRRRATRCCCCRRARSEGSGIGCSSRSVMR